MTNMSTLEKAGHDGLCRHLLGLPPVWGRSLVHALASKWPH